MGNDLVVAARQEVAKILTTLRPAMPLGLGYMSPSRLGIDARRLQIVHSKRSRNDVGDPGDLRIGRDVFKELDFHILMAQEFREYREGEKQQSRTVCASNTMKEPLDTVEQPRSQHCYTCAYSQWSDGMQGKRIPPPCAPGIAVLAVTDLEIEEEGQKVKRLTPFWYIARKTAVQPMEKTLKAVVKWPKMRGLPQVRFKMTTEEKTNNGVIWYVPTLTALSDPNKLPKPEEMPVIWGLAVAIFEQGLRFVPRVTGAAQAAVAVEDDDDDEASGIPAGNQKAADDVPDEIPFG